MRLALRELIRRPRRFFLPLGILLLLALLLLYPATILDGVYDSSVGAVRSLPGDLVVFSKGAHRSLGRSRIEAAERATAERIPGVRAVHPFNMVLISGRLPDRTESIGLAVLGVDRMRNGTVLDPGSALADESLKASGVTIGGTILVGPFKTPVRVAGFQRGSNLLAQGGVWVDEATWRSLLGQTRPDAALGAGVAQTVVIELEKGVDRAAVAAAIDEALGTTETLTLQQAIDALPGLEQQGATFGFIRTVTLTVALIVVALFLSFMTLERTPLYAVLKAVGASTLQLFGGLVTQVVAIVVVAVAIAAVLSTALILAVPIGIPISVRPTQVLSTAVALAATAALASCLSLRRVMRVDPASAFG